MRLGSRDRSGPELLDDRLTWQNRAVGQLLGIAASDQRMPTGHTQVQIFHADSLRSSFLTIRAVSWSPNGRWLASAEIHDSGFTGWERNVPTTYNRIIKVWDCR